MAQFWAILITDDKTRRKQELSSQDYQGSSFWALCYAIIYAVLERILFHIIESDTWDDSYQVIN